MGLRELELGVLAAARASAKTIRDLSTRFDGYEFQEPCREWVWQRLQEFASADESPTRQSIEARAAGEPEAAYSPLTECIAEVWSVEPSTTPNGDIDTLRNYRRQDELVKGLDRATKAIGRGDLDGAEAMLARLGSVPPSTEDQRPAWPTLAPSALIGIAGDVVRTLSPHSEADPVALLVQFITAFGNVIGRTAHYKVEGSRHHTNLFAVLVGETAKARKGTAWDRVLEIVGGLDDDWSRQSGLSTGEGLIHLVRDPITRKKRTKDGEEVEYTDDEGVADKRLLVIEPEFTRTLRSQSRDGNILSQVLREAWDSGNLATATRANPLRATEAHISIIGHVVRDELVGAMSSNEIAGGTANRILFLLVRRSKRLPHGGSLTEGDIRELQERTRQAVDAARKLGRVQLDNRARELWESVYDSLSEGGTGTVGRITARAEAQVVRLAVVYAALDSKPLISETHLQAALALWAYAETSARWIFGSQTGNALADKVRDAVKASSGGIALSEVWQLASRHGSKQQIENAIRLLEATGELRRETRATGGRPATMLVASSPASFASFAVEDGESLVERHTDGANKANEAPAAVPESHADAIPTDTRRQAMLARMAEDHRRVRAQLGDPAVCSPEAA